MPDRERTASMAAQEHVGRCVLRIYFYRTDFGAVVAEENVVLYASREVPHADNPGSVAGEEKVALESDGRDLEACV